MYIMISNICIRASRYRELLLHGNSVVDSTIFTTIEAKEPDLLRLRTCFDSVLQRFAALLLL